MKKIITRLIPALVILMNIFLNSCLKDEYEEYEKQEKDERNAYLQSLRNEGYTVIEEDGIYYVVINEGTGNTPVATDYIVINFTGRKTDNTIIETTDSSLIDDWANFQYLDHYVFGPKKIYLGNS
ncbi:MAG: hypothetical protein JSV22_03650, partial [Bacteroidales bacterium]